MVDTTLSGQATSGDTVRGYPVTVSGFGRRLVATLYDGFVLLFFSFLVACAIGFIGLFYDMFNPNDTVPLDRIIILSGIILSLVYYTGMWATSGQTLGKTLVGARVVARDGSGLGWGRALLRYVGYIVSSILLSLGFLWIVFDARRQGLHDKLAGSYVIDVDDSFSNADATRFVPADPPTSKWAWIALWLVCALFAPSALLGALWTLGPAMNRMITNLLQSMI